MQAILQYFKDYKVILGESYSHNGIDNFRLKGVLFCEPGTIQEIQSSLNKISEELKPYCNIDTSRGFIPSFNAPGRKNKPILNNEEGKLWEHNHKLSIVKLESSAKVKNAEAKVRVKAKHPPKKFQSAESIDEICLMYFENLGFEAMEPSGDYITFKHYSEVKSPGGFSWSKNNPYVMRHWNQERTIDAFTEIQKIPRVSELIKESLDYNSELLSYNPNTVLMKVNARYLEVTEEIQNNIWDFLESSNGIFSIRSPMGTGKSTVIKSIIDSAHDLGNRCLIITNRISVAEDFNDKYGVKLYNANPGSDSYIRGDSLICQFDSLWKYDIRDFDLIIMDEFISLMIHSRSELRNSALNLIKFFSTFNNKKLVIADAFLTGYERFLLTDKVDNNSFLLDNEYRDSTVLYDYKDRNRFVLNLLHTAREHKITVSSTSLRFLEDVRSMLQDNGLRTISLTADTPEHTKQLIYNTFKETHDKYDVLLYSPTLTVGVSNLNDINYHFHYDSSNSADVISSIQMIKRTRKAREIHLFVRESFKYLETNYDNLRKQYLDNVGKLGDFSTLFEINSYGDVQISELGKKALKIDIFKNILETNHKGAMLWLLRYHFKNEPRVVESKFGANILLKYTKLNREKSNQRQKELIKEFLSLSDVEISETSDNATLRKIADVHETFNIRKIQEADNPDEIKAKIIELALNNASFIEYCRNFNLFKGYLKSYYNDNDIKYRIQNYISDSDLDRVKFCSRLLRVNIRFSPEYELKELKDKNINYLLPRCGYKRASSTGHRYMRICPNVNELSKYINDI